MYTRVWADIDLNAVKYNIESMYKNINPNTKIAAVIKTDGYGHGAVAISNVLEDIECIWGYAVATVDEAMTLIEVGRKKPILILGISFKEQFEKIVEYDIRATVCEYDIAKALSDIAVHKNKTCHIHLKIDTGMSRIGFQVDEETATTIEIISKLPNIKIEGIFTHFARADEKNKETTNQQIHLFQTMIKMLEQRNIQIPIKHCSNSAGIVDIPEANMDMVRAGITLYGLWPSDEVNHDRIELKPVMSLKSHISFLKELKKGRMISYGGTYELPEDKRIATIPVGYGDGYARGLSNKGYVLIKGQKAHILGRICMDQFMVDVTNIENVATGDEVTLLGTDGEENITMEQLGELSGRFNYEFACLITERVPRVYHCEK